MGDKTAIEWTDATWTPIRATWFAPQSDGSGKERIGWHCEHVTEACRNCYAESLNMRLGTGLEFKPGHLRRVNKFGEKVGDVRIFLDDRLLVKPLHWRRPRHIFACSMTDLFGGFVADEMIAHCFAIMALADWHTFQVLTKRPERAKTLLTDPAFWLLVKYLMQRMVEDGVVKPRPINVKFPLSNVWLGVSIANQPDADLFVPQLIACPAVIRFVSYEPALGIVDLTAIQSVVGPRLTKAFDALRGSMWVNDGGGRRHLGGLIDDRGQAARLHWVIAGGESGRNARPSHPGWYRDMRDQCQSAGVPFYFKQWGEWHPSAMHDPETCPYKSTHAVHVGGEREFRPMEAYAKAHRAGWAGVCRVGKKRAGAMLDGREWREMPR